MYHLLMKNLVKNVDLLSDSHPSGGYWHDISSSVNNVVVMKKDYLSEIFLDVQIHDIMRTAFSSHFTSGSLPVVYTPEMEDIAYGKK